VKVLNGDCRDLFAELGDDSIDAIVTDPPYELGFMGKAWDASGIAYDPAVWTEALRVLKPGGHLLSFGGSRTYHRMACAIEDAGFEVRDQIMWLYGSGFPKSMDAAKAIDKKLGTEHLREFKSKNPADWPYTHKEGETSTGWQSPPRPDKTHPGSDEAQQWEGWGTALKPAHEPIVVARKPLIGTVAANVLEHGTGAINIDGGRVEHEGSGQWGTINRNATRGVYGSFSDEAGDVPSSTRNPAGRWPANVILDEEAGALLDEQSGVSKDGVAVQRNGGGRNIFPDPEKRAVAALGVSKRPAAPDQGYDGSGGASRFFYCAKASKRERNAGNVTNVHPTVKPIDLMRYLVRLVTPKGGTVLDPFTGSGTTGIAAVLEGMIFIGFEQSEEYARIADARITFWARDIQMGLDLAA
jgi:site-specific DNA-methyltransferase (adenine-specific)